MTEELKQYVRDNELIFKTWIEAKEPINIGNGLIQPLIEPFKERFPEVNLTGNCTSCIYDMLLWALDKIKQVENEKKNTGRVRGGK